MLKATGYGANGDRTVKAGPWLVWGLALVGLGVAAAAAAALLSVVGLPRLPRAGLVFVGAVAALSAVEMGLTVLSISVRRDLRIWRRGTPQLRIALRLAFVGRWLVRVGRERLLHSFIRSNNRLSLAALRGRTPRARARRGRLLLLAPTCLQSRSCSREITEDPSLCERCGKCPVKDLVELAEERRLELHFVGGGTLARALLEKRAPETVVAVACERELTEGIVFSRSVPILAIPNTRPNGPCVETFVDIDEVRHAVAAIDT